MHPDFQRLMQQATDLTRGGDLVAAADAIRTALGVPPPDGGAVRAPAGDIVIDVEAREVPDAASVPDDPPSRRASPAQGDDADTAPTLAEGRFVAGRAGALDYKLFIPPQAGGRPLPLVVMLHGCSQDPDDFAAGTRMNDAAAEAGCYVLYPAQSRRANGQGCWNWFKHTHQGRGRGEPAAIVGAVREVMGRHRVDPNRVYVAGLSAGGAMAAILGENYRDVFAAVGVHSGLASGAASDLPSALAAMHSGAPAAPLRASGRPTIVFHGDRDTTVHPDNGLQVAEVAAGAGPLVRETRSATGGRAVTVHVHRDAGGAVLVEHWVVHGAGHAWSGGSARGSYTDPDGPDATAEMLRFFLEHPLRP